VRRTITIIAGTLALFFGLAVPAFASSNPQPVTATLDINTVLTMTGISTAITLNQISATEATAPNAEVFQVSTNDGNGAVVTLSSDPNQINAQQDQFESALATGADSIMNFGNLTITDSSTDQGVTGVAASAWGQPGTTEAHTIGALGGPETANFNESWDLHFAPNQSANHYVESFVYQATAS
jgi:hypothetical protein